MLWLALRLLRPYLIAAAALTAASTTIVLTGAAVVQRQLDAQGMPNCVNPNWCWPEGPARTAILLMELTATFTPILLALIIGVPLFARERDEGTTAVALTQSVPRGRWVITKMCCALLSTAVFVTVVATTHRLVATRYTVLANDLYELLALFHSDHIGVMVMGAVLVTGVAAVIGLLRGGVLRTLALSVLAWPLTLAAAHVAGGLVWWPLGALVPADPAPAPDLSQSANDDRRWLDDITLLDWYGNVATPVFVLLAAGLVLLARRINARAAH
jgi:hypothetical protein